ncbi:hypothetical protein LCGC14_1895580, partial [marine sediment metagenome]
MSDLQLAKAIQELYYNSQEFTNTEYGTGDKTKALHNRVLYGLSKTFSEELPYIIPSAYYKPQIMVSFDFTHQFTSSAADQTGIQPSRPVSKETFNRAAATLIKYFEYYFNYAGSYNKVGRIGKSVLGDEDAQEESYLLLVNYIINYYLSAIATDSAVNQMGTCTINLNENKNHQNYQKVGLFYNKLYGILSQLFAPMVPVMVWGKGRLYKDWWFPIFDGYITSMEPSENAGFSQLTINCRDTLELARIATEMVNPSIIQIAEIMKQTGINIHSQPFYGIDHLEIFSAMFHGGQMSYDPETSRRILKLEDPAFKRGSSVNFSSIGNFKKASDADASSEEPERVADNFTAIHSDDMSLAVAIRATSHT